LTLVEVLEVRAAFSGAEAIGLVDGDDAQPREDRGAVGLAAQHDRPRALASLFDELAGSVDDAGDRTLKVAVVTAVEVVLVAAVQRACATSRAR
jgi:hypothetical protein